MAKIIKVRRFHILFLIQHLTGDGPINLAGTAECITLWNKVKDSLRRTMDSKCKGNPWNLPVSYYSLAIKVLGPLLVANDGALTHTMLERCYKMTEAESTMCAGKDEEYYRKSCILAKSNFEFYSPLKKVIEEAKTDDSITSINLYLNDN